MLINLLLDALRNDTIPVQRCFFCLFHTNGSVYHAQTKQKPENCIIILYIFLIMTYIDYRTTRDELVETNTIL
jgi:hypothetical protein